MEVIMFHGDNGQPYKSLVETDKIADGLFRAIPTIYSPESKIVMINIGPSCILKKDTKIGEATPLCVQSEVEREMKISLGALDKNFQKSRTR